jgi:hypothetical protein
MSHLIKLFNIPNLTNKLFLLVNHSNSTNTKVRIRKKEILTKANDNSGYKLDQNQKLIYLENHLNFSKSNQSKQILNQFLNDIKQFELKSKLKIEELQRTKKLNQSRLITIKATSIYS